MRRARPRYDRFACPHYVKQQASSLPLASGPIQPHTSGVRVLELLLD